MVRSRGERAGTSEEKLHSLIQEAKSTGGRGVEFRGTETLRGG